MRRITPGRITRRQAAKAAAAQQQHEQDQLLDYVYSFETEAADGSALANLLLDMLAVFIADAANDLTDEYALRPPVEEPGLYEHDGVLYRVQHSRNSRLYAMRLEDNSFVYERGAIYRLQPSDRIADVA
jgi:hypothetical protein